MLEENYKRRTAANIHPWVVPDSNFSVISCSNKQPFHILVHIRNISCYQVV